MHNTVCRLWQHKGCRMDWPFWHSLVVYFTLYLLCVPTWPILLVTHTLSLSLLLSLPLFYQCIPESSLVVLYIDTGGFLEQLLRGLAYPDEKVKSAIVYILAQLSTKTAANSLPASLVQSICGHVSSNLASAKSHTLTLNLLGLLSIVYIFF